MHTVNFIDGGYLNALIRRALPKCDGQRVMYDRLASFMASGCERPRTFYYNCLPVRLPDAGEAEIRQHARMERFLQVLEGLDGFEVRLGKLALKGRDAAGHLIVEQKRVDTRLTADMVRLAYQGGVEVMNLLSGDCDFIPAVEEARAAGVRVRLFHGPRDTCSQELFWGCDETLELTASVFASLSSVRDLKSAVA